jgi:hypothetical protein
MSSSKHRVLFSVRRQAAVTKIFRGLPQSTQSMWGYHFKTGHNGVPPHLLFIHSFISFDIVESMQPTKRVKCFLTVKACNFCQ